MKRLDKFLIAYRNNQTAFRKVRFEFPEDCQNITAGYYTVGDRNEAFCFVGYPKTEMPKNGYPAVVLVHGGEGYAFFEWVKHWTERGYVAIAPDLSGHCAKDANERLLENPKGGPSGYGSIEDYTSDCPWLFFCVASVLAAMDVLSADERVDADKIVAQGISWGGFVLLTAASREKRLKAISVVYSSAFISDCEWGRARGLGSFSREELAEYNENIDPQSYLWEIEMPVLFTAGMDDGAFTVQNRNKTAENILSQKLFSYRRSFIHGHVEGWSQEETTEFFERILAKKALPLLALADGETIVENINVTELFIVYTKEAPERKDICEWEEIAASKAQDALGKAKAYFLYGKTENGLQFSSKVYCKKS